eukprot:scaffold5904_cov165-Ochromonas_danica.AAC.2
MMKRDTLLNITFKAHLLSMRRVDDGLITVKGGGQDEDKRQDQRTIHAPHFRIRRVMRIKRKVEMHVTHGRSVKLSPSGSGEEDLVGGGLDIMESYCPPLRSIEIDTRTTSDLSEEEQLKSNLSILKYHAFKYHAGDDLKEHRSSFQACIALIDRKIISYTQSESAKDNPE